MSLKSSFPVPLIVESSVGVDISNVQNFSDSFPEISTLFFPKLNHDMKFVLLPDFTNWKSPVGVVFMSRLRLVDSFDKVHEICIFLTITVLPDDEFSPERISDRDSTQDPVIVVSVLYQSQ